MNHFTPDAISEIGARVYDRYLDGDPLEAQLWGVHPDFMVRSIDRNIYNLRGYKSGSPNLIGFHPVRSLVEADDWPVAIVDGVHYWRGRAFGIYLAFNSVAALAEEVGLEVTANA